jgi:hypothetical protein
VGAGARIRAGQGGVCRREEELLRKLRLIQGYYLASPLFWLMGFWWGWEIRVTFLPDPRLRFGYYVVLSVLGLLTHFRPSSAPWVALGESTLNLFLILAWILLPIYALPDTLGGGGAVGVPYTPGEVLVNGGLAGSVFLVGFYQAQSAILERFPWLGGRPRRSPRIR